MKKLTLQIVLFLISLLVLFSCNEQLENNQHVNAEWPADGIAYEIFVQSFYDSNGDGIGDIPGMTAKLDYLKELNVDAVWLMPIMPSPSYHKYDVVDYKGIDPAYGTMDEFKQFVTEAHSRNIKVIIDFIINHTSSQHPWFKNAKTGPDSKYRDYYVWANKDSIAQQIAKKETSFDSDNITQWHAVEGDTLADHYYGFFYGGMPDLNFDNPTVRNEIYSIGRYWLQDVGVDGFRMDAAKHIYPDDRAEDNHAFWTEFKQEMQKIKPDVYIVGEVWANAKTQAPFVKGFSALFNFDLAFSILESVNREKVVTASIDKHGWQIDSTQSFINKIVSNDNIYQDVNPYYTDAIFLSNHDQNRAMSVLGNNTEKAKLAAAIMLTLPGTPYIYYGEEIGMKGMKPDENIREPFLWEPYNNDIGRTKWITPVYSTDSTLNPLSIQKLDSNSLFSYYQKMISVRIEQPILALGDISQLTLDNKNLLVYLRHYKGDTLVVIHNLSKNQQKMVLDNLKEIILGDSTWFSDQGLEIPAYKSAIVKLD
ncbi:MAG TPA: alpha-amylase family glycosyl hydrolase [Fulvivirga sp.]|nr:alpha-amylase family glycosyl hydrolase [Fulvivirga sp.]